MKSDCSFVGGGIHYTRRNFFTKEATERFLKITLAKEPFCQLRLARYIEGDHHIAMRVWKDLRKDSLCYPLRTSTVPLDPETFAFAPSKLLFFYSTEHPEDFKSLNLIEETKLLQYAQYFEEKKSNEMNMLLLQFNFKILM